MKLIPPKTGWRTYAIVVAGVGLGVAQHFGWQIPTYVDWALAFLGMGTLRSAVTAQSAKSADAIADLIGTILTNVTIKETHTPNDSSGETVKTTSVEMHVLPPVPGAKVE